MDHRLLAASGLIDALPSGSSPDSGCGDHETRVRKHQMSLYVTAAIEDRPAASGLTVAPRHAALQR